MNMETVNAVQRRTRQVARQYKSNGYVVRSKSGQFKPTQEIEGVTPDIVARKGGKTVIIEVKSRASLANSGSDLKTLSEYARAKSGYRFDLVVTNAPYGRSASTAGKRSPKAHKRRGMRHLSKKRVGKKRVQSSEK